MGAVAGRSDRALAETLLRAVDHGLAGDWERAHAIAQDHEGDERANWIHAVAHRMEGDLENARYWYRRCRRELREDVSAESELREIKAMLEGGS